MTDLATTYAPALLHLAAAALAALLTLYAPRLVAAIHAHVHQATLARALEYVTLVTAQVVAGTAAEVRDLKDPASPGTWSAAVGAQVKAAALAQVKTVAAAQVALLRAQVGAGGSLDDVLGRLVEAAVEQQRPPPVGQGALTLPVVPARSPTDPGRVTTVSL